MRNRQQAASHRKPLNFAHRAVWLRRQKNWGMTIGFSSLALAVPSLMFMHRYPALVPTAYLGAVPMGLIAVAAVALPWATAANAWRNRMIEDARKSQDKRAVGVLLDAYQEYAVLAHVRTSSDVLPLIVADLGQTLAAILPQIEEADSLLFTHAQHKTLRILVQNRDSATVWSALQALGKIGNGDDLSMVQTLAAGAWNAAVDPRLAEKAELTAAQILARLAAQNNTQTLLRGSASPERVPVELLRPATPQANRTDAEQLLRAERSTTEE